MRREERVTVQGLVKEQQPDGMSHRGGGGGRDLLERLTTIGGPPAWSDTVTVTVTVTDCDSASGFVMECASKTRKKESRLQGLGGAHHNQQRECHTRPWVLAHQCVTCR